MPTRNEDQRLIERPFSATAAVAAGAANIALVTFTLRNARGDPVPYGVFEVYLSDSAVGAGLTATAASGAVAAGAAGADLGTGTAKKHLRVQAGAAGTYILSITDTAKTLFVVCSINDGLPQVHLTLVTGNYG